MKILLRDILIYRPMYLFLIQFSPTQYTFEKHWFPNFEEQVLGKINLSLVLN
jgi:hypothetical protein